VPQEEERVEVGLLGPVEAAVGGRPVDLGGPRQRTLLALLALDPGAAVSTDRLADELWHGAPPAGAETTLRSYVSRLRRALGADAVSARAGGYRLEVAAEGVDAVRFERLLAQGREALAGGAAGLAAEHLHAALALWRGPALAGVAAEGALATEARRLDALRLDCVEERAGADLELGRHAAVVPELRALTASEPYRERLWCRLALALYRCGRQAEALAACAEARRALDEGLGLEPGAELRELERAILNHAVPAVESRDVRDDLPAPLTTFVGRERELAELGRLLVEQRLVTLVGFGGSGKTRLAVEAGRRHAGAWRDGVRLADLTGIGAPSLVVSTVAEAIGATDRTLEAVVDHARTRELLLVLDNCEHVAEACADLVSAVLPAARNVRVLATSRVPLGVEGELELAVDPLDAEAAVRLFVDRASAVRRLDPDREDDEAVEAICRELDRLPLSIELAAARVKALSLDEIAARLDDRFQFLRAWRRVADPRHRTLEATMDWSYALLGEDEQRLLRRLAAFAGGATGDAVAAVCAGGDEAAATDLLGRLVDASLVRAEPGVQTRYRLLETVRQYATGKLAEDPDELDVRRRHAHWFAALADASNLSIDALGRGEQRHEPVLREQHNLWAAVDWAEEHDVGLALRLLVSLENYLITHALPEAELRYARLLPRADGVDPLTLARATRDYAATLECQLRPDESLPVYERSRELFHTAGYPRAAAYVTYRLGVVWFHRDRERRERYYREALAQFAEHPDPVAELQIEADLGWIELYEGDYDRGVELVDDALETARRIGWRWWETKEQLVLAEAAVDHGRPDDAERRIGLGLPLALRIENRQYVLLAVALAARVAALRGDGARARLLWATVEATEDSPGRFGRFDRTRYAAEIPAGDPVEPLPLADAAALVLRT
jgi:predicted ATPase/DNA-binding SARP family transcriptional activator